MPLSHSLPWPWSHTFLFHSLSFAHTTPSPCTHAPTQVVDEPCENICVPLNHELLGASFDNDLRRIVIALSATAAHVESVSCGAVFDAATAAKLGGGASCSASGKVWGCFICVCVTV